MKRAAQSGMPAVALTDQANLFGLVKFYRKALAGGVKPIIGVDINNDRKAWGERGGSVTVVESPEIGIIGANHKLTPRASRPWDELTEAEQDAEDLKMAVYAAMIDRVDQNLGRLFAKVNSQASGGRIRHGTIHRLHGTRQQLQLIALHIRLHPDHHIGAGDQHVAVFLQRL